MKRRVVITGMGGISPIGNNVKDIWLNAQNGVCGIDRITQFDTTDQKVHLAAEVKNFNIDDYMDKRKSKRLDRFVQFALIASKEALDESGLDLTTEDTDRVGVTIASGIGGLGVIETEHSKGLEKGFDRVSPFFIPMAITNMAAGMVAIEYGLKGSCTCIVTACAGATNAIGESFRQIRHGYADIVVAGGAESCVTPLGIGGFTAIKALSSSTDKNRASIPFDKERNGFVMGEGAAILVLEDYDHAVKRGAKILGEVVGYGSTCDAFHMTAPSDSGIGAAKAMINAINDAGITPDKIDYINAHGTSTPMNDKCETLAVKNAFGGSAGSIPMSSTKSMTGHLLGASGALEAVITISSMNNSFVPPTIGYEVSDPDCDLDIVPNKGRAKEIKYAMSNSLGFGGHNASLIFKKY
jgi:3-oxoacyl-[acyl-carrier-protein] synthase II